MFGFGLQCLTGVHECEKKPRLPEGAIHDYLWHMSHLLCLHNYTFPHAYCCLGPGSAKLGQGSVPNSAKRPGGPRVRGEIPPKTPRPFFFPQKVDQRKSINSGSCFHRGLRIRQRPTARGGRQLGGGLSLPNMKKKMDAKRMRGVSLQIEGVGGRVILKPSPAVPGGRISGMEEIVRNQDSLDIDGGKRRCGVMFETTRSVTRSRNKHQQDPPPYPQKKAPQ